MMIGKLLTVTALAATIVFSHQLQAATADTPDAAEDVLDAFHAALAEGDGEALGAGSL